MSMIKKAHRESDIATFADNGERYAIRRLWTAIEVLEADNKLLRERCEYLLDRTDQLSNKLVDHISRQNAGYPGYD